jgi:hypothetical protein
MNFVVLKSILLPTNLGDEDEFLEESSILPESIDLSYRRLVIAHAIPRAAQALTIQQFFATWR